MNNQSTQPSYWFARTDEKGAGPTYIVGRGDEEITHPCLFQHEAQAIVEALRAALAQGEQEPHGYLWFTRHMEQKFTHRIPKEYERIGDVKPVYTAPPQREWQGLTDEEIKAEVLK